MNYQNGKIYTIRSHQTPLIYIGGTCTALRKRMHKHRSMYRMYLKGSKKYISSFEILKYDDAYIELLELCPCNMKIELDRREGQLIRSHDCVNKIIPGRTRKEYYQDNKDRIKQYYQDNKDRIKEYQKKRRMAAA